MDHNPLRVLYAISDPRAPQIPESLLHLLEAACDVGLLARDRYALNDAGKKELCDGLKAIADDLTTVEIPNGEVKIRVAVRLVGGILAADVTLLDNTQDHRAAPAAWWVVHHAFYPITQHCFRIDLV